jgi:mxaJ protein
MSLRFLDRVAGAICAALAVAGCTAGDGRAVPQSSDVPAHVRTVANARSGDRVLRVCADPNNLPFSNQREEGFENRMARLLGTELNARLEYTWFAQRRGFIRNTLRADLCDVVMGVPTSFELVLPTRPYYRSTYVFVTRPDGPRVRSFDDPVLRTARVGVQLIGDDGTNTPPAHALTRRGIVRNVSGYTVYGDYREPNPPARIIDAVARGDIDVAVAWGPLAGYFADRGAEQLRIVPVSPQIDLPYLPFVFDISMGVRRADVALRDELDRALVKRRPEIDAILDEYHVPRVGSRAAEPRT